MSSIDSNIKKSAMNPAKDVKEKPGLQIDSRVLNDYIGELSFPDEMGRKVYRKLVSHTHVGEHRAGPGKMLPIFRVNVWADWWYSDSQRFPSSRIAKSYYVAYDKGNNDFIDLDVSSDIMEVERAEVRRKQEKIGFVNNQR